MDNFDEICESLRNVPIVSYPRDFQAGKHGTVILVERSGVKWSGELNGGIMDGWKSKLL